MPAISRDKMDAFRAVIEFFRWDLWAAYRAVRVHVPDDRGGCAGCHTERYFTPWPCVVADAAHKALSLSGLSGDPARP